MNKKVAFFPTVGPPLKTRPLTSVILINLQLLYCAHAHLGDGKGAYLKYRFYANKIATPLKKTLMLREIFSSLKENFITILSI